MLSAGVGQKKQCAPSAASDTHRPETSNETSSSGGGGSSGSRNRTSKMAAPSASPPLLQAEGSLGGREFLTEFTHYRKNLGPYLPLLVDSASPDCNFSWLPSPMIQELGPRRGLFAKEEVTAPGRATQSVARVRAVTDDARRCRLVPAAKSLSEKDPADPGADGHWFRLGEQGLPGSDPTT